MIKTEVIKTVILEESVIDKLKEFTESDNIEGFIKTFIDWIIENEIEMDYFYLKQLEYKDNKDRKRVEFENILDKYNSCYNLTGLDERSFADWIYVNRKGKVFYSYKGYLIKPTYNIKTDSCLDDYRCGPQFIIYSPEEVKEII